MLRDCGIILVIIYFIVCVVTSFFMIICLLTHLSLASHKRANSVDADQTPQNAAFDHSLYYLH